jgi:hypothetical protein
MNSQASRISTRPTVTITKMTAVAPNTVVMCLQPSPTIALGRPATAHRDPQCTPQPIRCFLQKLTLTGVRERIAKKSYIRATGVSIPYFEAKGRRTYEVPCGHDVMLDIARTAG